MHVDSPALGVPTTLSRTRQAISSCWHALTIYGRCYRTRVLRNSARKFERMHAHGDARSRKHTLVLSSSARGRCYAKHSPFIIKQSENSISTKLSNAPSPMYTQYAAECARDAFIHAPVSVHCARLRCVPLLSAHHNKSVVIFIIHYYFSLKMLRAYALTQLCAVAGPSVFPFIFRCVAALASSRK